METLNVIVNISFVLGFLLISLATIMQYGRAKYSEGDLNGLKEGIRLGENISEKQEKVIETKNNMIKKQKELILKQDNLILLLKEEAKENNK